MCIYMYIIGNRYIYTHTQLRGILGREKIRIPRAAKVYISELKRACRLVLFLALCEGELKCNLIRVLAASVLTKTMRNLFYLNFVNFLLNFAIFQLTSEG